MRRMWFMCSVMIVLLPTAASVSAQERSSPLVDVMSVGWQGISDASSDGGQPSGIRVSAERGLFGVCECRPWTMPGALPGLSARFDVGHALARTHGRTTARDSQLEVSVVLRGLRAPPRETMAFYGLVGVGLYRVDPPSARAMFATGRFIAAGMEGMLLPDKRLFAELRLTTMPGPLPHYPDGRVTIGLVAGFRWGIE